jgi:hypothetical protein
MRPLAHNENPKGRVLESKSPIEGYFDENLLSARFSTASTQSGHRPGRRSIWLRGGVLVRIGGGELGEKDNVPVHFGGTARHGEDDMSVDP